MTDASTFGGGTAMDGAQDQGITFGSAFGSGGGASAGPGGGADATPTPSAPPTPSTPSLFGAPDPSQPSPMQQFGAGLAKLTGAPSYKPSDPNTSALDKSADLLQQRIDRASSVASNPILQFFNPEGAAKARDAVPKMTEQLQEIQQQKAKQLEIKKLATNYGIDNIPQGADRETATNLIADELHARYLDGDPMAAQGLQQLGRTDLVQAGGEQALSAAAANNQRYRDVIGKLTNMRNPGEYAAAYKELEQQTKDGVHGDHELASVPKTYDEFQKKKQNIGVQLSMQQMQLDSLKARMQQLAGVTPIQKSVDKDGNAIGLHAAISSQVTDNNGNVIKAEPVTVGGIYNGNRFPHGSDKIGDAGVKWGAMDNKEITTVQDRIKPEAQTITRSAGISKLNDISSQKDFGTNPWLLGHGIDQFVEISRNGVGGKGSATPGTISIMENLRGYLQTAGDKAQREWRQVEDWVDGGKKGPMPYMSRETIGGLKSAITTLKAGSDKEIGGVAGGTAEYVGRHGGKLDDLGLDPGLQDVLRDRWAKGNQEFKQDIASRPSVVMGGQRIVFDRAGVAPPQALTPGGFEPQAAQPPNSSNNGAQVPPSSSTAPPLSPGAGAPPAGVPPGSPGPAGGGSPGGGSITIGGQPITPNVPPGVSPNFVPAMQRIESGNNKNPWTATTPGSSASGAFQMIDSTWNANKPPGAPNRAKDATPEQQTQANDKFMAANAAALKGAGVPVNDTNMYVAHNLGSGGAAAMLRASANADARSVVGEAAAKNNPLFFKGKPTVATVLARYQAEMAQDISDSSLRRRQTGLAQDISDSVPKSVTAGPPPQDHGLWSKVGDLLSTKGTNAETGLTPEGQKAVGEIATEHAPAIGSTIGAVVGTAGGPLGTMAGGGVGGAAGQAVKDYVQGSPQSPAAIAKQGALGAVLGIAPEARPILGAAARVLGVGGVDAGVTAAQGGDNSDILKAGLEGGAYALGGEALGRFVSMGGAQAFKALSRYTPSAQAELSANAGKLAEARATLASEQPKLPGDAGPNPKYDAAQKQADDATQAIKDHGQNPDDMVHAYEQAKAGTSRGEAAVMRPAQAEKTSVTQGYDDLRKDVRETGVGAPKPNQMVPDGPVAQLRTAENPRGKVPEEFRPEAEHAEMLIKAPAKDWGAKWQDLQDAGSELIKKRLAFIVNGDKPSADAMDNIFQGVRNQQKAAATYVFGKEGGEKVIAQLENLDTRYAKVMNATGGMKYEKMQAVLASGNTPARRELEKNFTEFAKGDPSAIRAFNAMKAGAKGDWKSEAALMGPVIAGEVAANLHGVPTVGAITALVGGHRLYKLAQGYMNAKLLNRAVTFKDFLAQEVKSGLAQFTGTAAQRGATMQQ